MVESTSHSNIFTIPNGTPFLETLYKALVDGALISGFDPTDPMAWSDLTILVPTRRAGRALRDLILMESAAEAVLLPRIRPIGDVDDDLDGLDVEDAEPDIPPAVPEFDRQLALAKLVLKWARTIDDADGPSGPVRIPASAADAAWLARDLATLMDQMATEEVSWEGLASLVPEDHAAYWQLSLGFLSIATELWPAYLTERGFLGRAERRSLLIDREARRLAAGKGGRPVIAAGSTGSIPATARLLANVAQLERGAVVLPGLPVSMDEAAWQAVLETKSGQSAPSHPLYAMKHLIAAMGANRSTIRPLGPSPDPATDTKRQAILEVFRPADVTDGWMDTIQTIRQADLTSITLVEAPGDREEATSIALALREFVEAEAGRAALITPDRNLAKRVTASLRRWAIDVDDSAGEPIMTTPAGALFRLVAEVALSGLEPVALMALTKHPLARFSEMPGQIRYAARMLELGVLRGPRPAAGLKGLAAATGTRGSGETAIGTRRAKRSQIDETAWGKVDTLVERLTTALGPLDSIRERDAPTSFAELLKHHIAALREVVADPETGERGFFDRPDGSALLTGLAGLLSAAETDFDLRPAEYVDFLESLLAGLVVRPVRPADPRVQILSPLEARLQSPDFTILSGLNEGVWPALPETDPWLSRPMRSDLGLPPPERRIGQSAHDFMQGLAGNRVLLTRSEKSDGAPTVPSRWLQRLRPVVGTENHAAMKERGKRYGDWTTRLDEPTHPTRPAIRPRPAPPVDLRPLDLSVTDVETLIRDPYALYARRVLRLEPLDPIGTMPDMADRGTLIHAILRDFTRDWSGPFGVGALADLLERGRHHFERLKPYPALHGMWWARFQRIAAAFISWEQARDSRILNRHAEIKGTRPVELTTRTGSLTGRADRIDRYRDGGLEIIDFKTGAIPSVKQVNAGFAPQLPLEGALLVRGGFDGLPVAQPGRITALTYLHLKPDAGGLPLRDAIPKSEEAAATIEQAWSRLTGLLSRYENPDQPYLSRAFPLRASDHDGPYDHLARVAEWSLHDEGDES